MFKCILFGSKMNHDIMLRLGAGYWMETVPAFESRNFPKQLRGSGLIAFADYGYAKPKRFWNLETRHPAYPELIEVIEELGVGTSGQTMPPGFKLGPQVPVSPTRPLGDRSDTTFEVLVVVATWPEPPTRRHLRQSRRTAAGQTGMAVDELLEQGVLELDVASLVFAEDLPSAFPRLVRWISEVLGPREGSLRPEATGARTAAYAVAPDGAPRFFGPDLHLRNLMALARHGPLHHSDLARIVGASVVKEHDGYRNAPFGRGGLVVSFDTANGRAVALDSTHPFAPELRTLLLRMLELYPFRYGLSRRYDSPTPPTLSGLPWTGDKCAFFGQAIQSSILFTVAELGWTFGAVCVQVAKSARENVKSALTSMEVDDGLLQSSRPPGPGFGARIVTIADRFGAKRELEALLLRVKTEWPDVTTPAGQRAREPRPEDAAVPAEPGLRRHPGRVRVPGAGTGPGRPQGAADASGQESGHATRTTTGRRHDRRVRLNGDQGQLRVPARRGPVEARRPLLESTGRDRG